VHRQRARIQPFLPQAGNAAEQEGFVFFQGDDLVRLFEIVRRHLGGELGIVGITIPIDSRAWIAAGAIGPTLLTPRSGPVPGKRTPGQAPIWSPRSRKKLGEPAAEVLPVQRKQDGLVFGLGHRLAPSIEESLRGIFLAA